MVSTQEYTAEDATRMYLDHLKRSNPSPAVQAVIVEVEEEIARGLSNTSGRRKPRRKASLTRRLVKRH